MKGSFKYHYDASGVRGFAQTIRVPSYGGRGSKIAQKTSYDI